MLPVFAGLYIPINRKTGKIMLPTNTAFIIGARSGFDIKMPLGSDLIKIIERKTKFKYDRRRIAEDTLALVQAMYYKPIDGTNNITRRQNQQEIFNITQK